MCQCCLLIIPSLFGDHTQSLVCVDDFSSVNAVWAVHLPQFMGEMLEVSVVIQKLLYIGHFAKLPYYPCSQACNESPSRVLRPTQLSSIQTF